MVIHEKQPGFAALTPALFTLGVVVGLCCSATHAAAAAEGPNPDSGSNQRSKRSVTRSITLTASPGQINPAGAATYTATTSNVNRNSSIKVNYAMSGTATMGTDYTLSRSTGQIVIKRGASSGSVTLNALAGSSSTENRIATMSLTSGSGYTVSSPSVASVTINFPAPTPTPTATPTPTPTPTITPSPSPIPSPSPAATPTPVPVPLSSPTQQVWIAMRTDGLPGSGTESDPYDGSTQPKFDALMSQFAPNTAIHLGPGTFQTHGGMSWQVRDGWQILGAGIDTTTLVQTAIQDAQFQVIGGLGNNVVVSGLTVDCNYIALSQTIYGTNKAIGAVSAASGYINNVRVIHAGGQHETFTLGFCQYGVGSTPPTSVLIENCVVEDNGPYVTAIWAHDSQGATNRDPPGGGQATIRNCTVVGNGDRTDGGVGIQINGYQSGIIDHCTVSGSTYAVYRDTLRQTNLWITNSNITGVVNAIGLCGSMTMTQGVTISGNTLAAGDIIVRTDGATNVMISDNVLLPGPNYNNWYSPFQTTASTYINSNQLSPAITDGGHAVPLGNMYGNRYFDGTIVPFLLDNYTP
jgi:hypothetical protein